MLVAPSRRNFQNSTDSSLSDPYYNKKVASKLVGKVRLRFIAVFCLTLFPVFKAFSVVDSICGQFEFFGVFEMIFWKFWIKV